MSWRRGFPAKTPHWAKKGLLGLAQLTIVNVFSQNSKVCVKCVFILESQRFVLHLCLLLYAKSIPADRNKACKNVVLTLGFVLIMLRKSYVRLRTIKSLAHRE